jgi:NAD+ kinase
MAETIRNVAIITKINSIEAEKAAIRITNLLTNKNVKVYSISPLIMEGSKPITAEGLRNFDIDFVFAIGGDGTTLRTFRIIQPTTPVFSMNVGGKRGILSEAGVNSIDDAINSILSGDYFYDSRLRIQASFGGNVVPPALNDILITRTSLTRTPVLSIKMMGDEIKQRMDGVIISTPTGSTGHAFSIGGPVLHESLNCLLVSPVASINRMPYMIIPNEDIEIRSSHDLQLVIDGQEVFKLEKEQTIKISRFSFNAQFIRIRKNGVRQLAKLGF